MRRRGRSRPIGPPRDWPPSSRAFAWSRPSSSSASPSSSCRWSPCTRSRRADRAGREPALERRGGMVETETARETAGTIKIAALVGAAFGALTLLGTPPVLVELQRTGELPLIFGDRALGGGPFEALPVPTLLALGRALVGMGVVEVMSARWTWVWVR